MASLMHLKRGGEDEMIKKAERYPERQPNSTAGFTLIEIMTALVVLAIGLLALAQLQVAAIGGIGSSRQLTVATQLAEGQMDRLMSYPFPENAVSNINYYPKNALDQPFTAETDAGASVSVFYDVLTVAGDKTYGDHAATRLWAPNPVNAQGQPATAGEQAYIVTWTVERGGSEGTPKLPGKNLGLPGPYLTKLVVNVLWFEKGQGTAFTYTRPASGPLVWSNKATLEGMRALDLDAI